MHCVIAVVTVLYRAIIPAARAAVNKCAFPTNHGKESTERPRCGRKSMISTFIATAAASVLSLTTSFSSSPNILLVLLLALLLLHCEFHFQGVEALACGSEH